MPKKHKPPHEPVPIERKTIASTGGGGIVAALIAVIVAADQAGTIDISSWTWLPTWLQPLLVLVGIPAAVFGPGYATRHTQRFDRKATGRGAPRFSDRPAELGFWGGNAPRQPSGQGGVRNDFVVTGPATSTAGTSVPPEHLHVGEH